MIYCCGEALIDMIPSPTRAGEDGYVPHTGGAVFNTAIALGRLGARVGMLTGLSRDPFGQRLERALHASHVETPLVILSDRPTTLAFVALNDGHARYVIYDENSAGRMIEPADLPILPDAVSALFLGGISLAVEPAAETYATLLARSTDSRAVMLDPNIRPGFVRDQARYRARLARMLAQCDIVKVSVEDLNWIYPGPEALETKVQQLRGAGPCVVVLTRGSRGATAFLASGETVSVSARPVSVVDTVGAGDTFNAGLLAGLSEHGVLTKPGLAQLPADALAAAMDLAARAAAISVARVGANPPWRNELA